MFRLFGRTPRLVNPYISSLPITLKKIKWNQSVFWKQCLITSPENKIITIPMNTKLITRNIKSLKPRPLLSDNFSVWIISSEPTSFSLSGWRTFGPSPFSVTVLFSWRLGWRFVVTFLTLREFSTSKSSLTKDSFLGIWKPMTSFKLDGKKLIDFIDSLNPDLNRILGVL